MAKKPTGRQRSEARRTIVISNPSVCYYCKSSGLTHEDKLCPNCGFPQRGSQAAMKRFIWNVNNKHILLNDYANAMDKAAYILISISALSLIMAFFFLNSENTILKLSFIVTSVIFMILWYWSKFKPKQAFLTGFVVYALFLIVSGIMEPSSIAAGALGKIYILAGLYFGFTSIKKGILLFAELESIKRAVDLKINFQETEENQEE